LLGFFETLLLVHQLSTTDVHILAHLDVADLNRGEGLGQSNKSTLITHEVFLGSSVAGMRKHNMTAAVASQRAEMHQQNVWNCAKPHLLFVSTNGLGI